MYLMSGDTIPLKRSTSFVNDNKHTNIKIQKNPTEWQAKFNSDKYNNLTTAKFKSKISELEWVKQNMFFCISKKDFYKLKTPKILKSDIFVFRSRINEEDRILNIIDELELNSIGRAALTPSFVHQLKMSRSKYFKALICVGENQYLQLIDSPIKKKIYQTRRCSLSP